MEVEGLKNIQNISSRVITQKKSAYYFRSVPKNKVDEFKSQGWEIVPSKLKKSVRICKPKPHNIAFEDRIWALVAKMGFEYLNEDSNFKIQYSIGLSKQIDVFAADNESILIIECKSSEKRKRANYQKDINEFIALKEKLRIVAQNILQGTQKIAFLFVTNNTILSDNDKKRLSDDLIWHLNQDDIEYYEQLTDHLGTAAKYQLFGKLFAGQKIPELKNRVPVIKGKLANGQTFYSFSIEPEFLLKIGFILHRTETNINTVNAYQRLVKKSRLKVIGDYIDKGGYFPNSLIINIRTSKKKPLRFDRAISVF